MFAEGRQTPFEADVVLLQIINLLKIVVFLVNRVVSKVDKLVSFTVGMLHVFHRCEAGEAFFVDVDPQRIQRGDEHVDSQVELVTIDQQRVAYVPLDHGWFVYCDFGRVFNEIDASSSRQIIGLDYPCVSFAV